jgi:hypothetical protein
VVKIRLHDISTQKSNQFFMSALRCLIPLGTKVGNGGWRSSLLRFPKRLLLSYLPMARDSVLHWLCPVGYEDETGFHYGKPGHDSAHGGSRTDDSGASRGKGGMPGA